MRQTRTVLLVVLVISSTVVAIGQQTPQLTDVPPKPTCTLLFQTGSCADVRRNYNQAVARRQQEEIQLYVNRQKELASQAATAPLQQQIANLTILTEGQQAQIRKLQQKIESDASSALEARLNAHQQGLWEGAAVGGAGVLVLIAVILGVRRISRSFAITKKSQPA
jgi:hypothetical protein